MLSYLPVFENEQNVTAFFSTTAGASPCSPYDNAAVLKELGIVDGKISGAPLASGCVKVWPHQVHGSRIAIVDQQLLLSGGIKEAEMLQRHKQMQQAGDRKVPDKMSEEKPEGEQEQKGACSCRTPNQEELGRRRPGLEEFENGETGLPEGCIVLPDTDGSITDVPGVLLTTCHADCLAVFFYDPVRRAIGVVHAGWRGTLAGIAPAAVRLLQDTYGCRPQNIRAWISPGISRCCFETGPEVYQAFRKKWDFIAEFTDRGWSGTGKDKIDLKGINERQLRMTGLADIAVSPYCTCCAADMFISYRREKGTKARLGAGICLL